MSKLFIYMMVIAVIAVASVSATTINVPADYAAIQAGIDASSNGDTVLVQQGIYAEHINFSGKAIVVKSAEGAYTAIIERAVEDSSIVTFDSGEDNSSVLDGFTVRNAVNSHGISCIGSSPVIINCIIEDNSYSNHHGAGICFRDNSAPIIRKNVIRNNYAKHGAGINGIYCDQDHIALIDSNYFYNNTTSINGSAFHSLDCVCIFRCNLIYTNHASTAALRIDASGIIIENNTFCNNTATRISGSIYADGDYSTDTYIRNNIIFNNSQWGIFVRSGSNYHLSYNCFYGNGAPYYNITPEEGNIYEDPLFADTSVNNYNLTSLSPCIDAGDSLSPYDPDSSVADIGALYYSGYYNTGNISGFIKNGLDETLEGVHVEVLDYNIIDTSGIDGSFMLENLAAPISHDLFFSLPGYYDTVIADVFVYQNDTTIINLEYRLPSIVSGIVTNLSSEVIEGVCVEIENNSEINDTTDINGEYMFEYKQGVFSIVFSHPEYCDTTIVDVFNNSDTLYLDVVMGVGNSVVTGTVIDSLLLHNLYNVSVTTFDIVSMTVMTNSAGDYILPNICEGVHDIIFSKPGYNDFIISDVEIEANDTVVVDAAMTMTNGVVFSWAGGTIDEYVWHDTITVVPDTWIDIPVYLMGSSPDVWVANLCLPLGINLTYVDAFDPGACHYNYPFTQWADVSFANENCNPPLPEGWCSLSFVSFDLFGWTPAHWETPTLGFTFRVHVADIEIENDTVIFDAIDVGNDPFQPPHAGDTCGAAGYHIIDNWACLYFSKNLYLPGDVNMFLGIWPPMVIGGDITYLVNFFKGSPSSQQCLLNDFWCSADANGDCLVMGSDVVKLGRYFNGEDSILYCPDYPPTWFTTDDIPDDPPLGWPPCETPTIFDEGKDKSPGSVK